MTEPGRGRYLTADEAAGLLGVTAASLYAYVSRGRIHAETDPRNPRKSRYLTADVLRLRDRKQARLHPDIAARKSLSWGIPLLESGITLIDAGRFYYRGQDALALAKSSRFEDVVRLLWGRDDVAGDGSRLEAVRLSSPVHATSPALWKTLARIGSLPVMERLQAILPAAASDDPAAFDVKPETVAITGWRILSLLSAVATLGSDGKRGRESFSDYRREKASRPLFSIAASLSSGWKIRTQTGRRLLESALILCADHELNVSAFAARVVASTGSSPYDVVAAGLAALRGPRHGGHSARVESFLDESGSAAGVPRAIADRLRRGESVPGFGHPLYPDGDPRARLLLDEVERAFPDSNATAYSRAVKSAGRALLAEHPNLDLGLVVMRRALGLPRGSAIVIFALGRTVGWIAHAMEQYASDQLIRPRAAYTGPPPRA